MTTPLTPEQVVASNIKFLRMCVTSASIEFRRYAASCHNTPVDVLIKLSREKALRKEILENTNTPPAVKMWLQGGYGEMSLEEFLEAVK